MQKSPIKEMIFCKTGAESKLESVTNAVKLMSLNLKMKDENSWKYMRLNWTEQRSRKHERESEKQSERESVRERVYVCGESCVYVTHVNESCQTYGKKQNEKGEAALHSYIFIHICDVSFMYFHSYMWHTEWRRRSSVTFIYFHSYVWRFIHVFSFIYVASRMKEAKAACCLAMGWLRLVGSLIV